MKKLVVYTFALLMLVFFQACLNRPGSPGKTIITGSFPQFKGKSIILSEIDIRKTNPLDTAVLSEQGDFRFRIDRDSAGLYLLKLDNKNYLTLVLDLERKVRISSNSASIRGNYQVEGSEESQRLGEYEATLEKNKKVVDSLALAFNDGQSTAGFSVIGQQMEEEYVAVFNDQKKITEKFIEDNCGSLASLLVLNRRFGQRRILSEEEDGRYYLMVDSCLSAKYPGNKHLLEHKKRVENIVQQKTVQDHWDKLLAIGQKAPDITLENPEGKSISLHSLAGKKVIVYFWASWDKNSRQVNKEMVRVYDSFKKDGLQVYAIGLESYRDTWTGAIKADGLTWINVTDYLHLQSGSITLFNVPKDLPYFYLLDEGLFIRYKGNNVIELIDELKH
jgi:peroxiredoxin